MTIDINLGSTVLCHEIRPHQSPFKAYVTTHHDNTTSISDASSSLDKGQSQLRMRAGVVASSHDADYHLTCRFINTDNRRSTTHPTSYTTSTPRSQARTTCSSRSVPQATATQTTKSSKASTSPKLRSRPATSPWAPSLL
jgi:hypothetical protein